MTEMRMAPDQVRAAVEPAGFRLSRVVELPPYHYGAIFIRGGCSPSAEPADSGE